MLLIKVLLINKRVHHLLLFFVHSGMERHCTPLYQNKLLEPGIQDVVNNNKTTFKPYDDLVDKAFSHYNESIINNQDLFDQIENDETGGAI